MKNSLISYWERTCKLNSNKTAIVDLKTNKRLTIKECQSAIQEKVNQSQLLNFQYRIGIFQLENSIDWFIHFMAFQYANVIPLPIDPDTPPPALQKVRNELKAALVIDGDRTTSFTHSNKHQQTNLVKLTSGSTGSPRPFFFEAEQLVSDGKNIITTMGISPQDTNLGNIPFGHSYGFGNLILPLIIQGTPIVIPESFFPHDLATTIEEEKISVFPTIPLLIRALTKSEIDPKTLKSLRLVISAGSPIEPKDAQKFHEKFGIKIHNFLGTSETGGIAYDQTGDDTLRGTSIGEPLSGVTVTTTQKNRLKVSSNAVVKKYNRNRHNGKPAFIIQDYGDILPDGKIKLKGRQANLVKIAGKRLDLREVEVILLNLKEVQGAHIFLFPCSKNRTKIGAMVATQLSAKKIEAHLQKFLPAWKIPTKLICIPDLPFNKRGKVDRSAVRKYLKLGETY